MKLALLFWLTTYVLALQRLQQQHIEVFYTPDITVIDFSSRKTYNVIRIKVFNITFFNLK